MISITKGATQRILDILNDDLDKPGPKVNTKRMILYCQEALEYADVLSNISDNPRDALCWFQHEVYVQLCLTVKQILYK